MDYFVSEALCKLLIVSSAAEGKIEAVSMQTTIQYNMADKNEPRTFIFPVAPRNDTKHA